MQALAIIVYLVFYDFLIKRPKPYKDKDGRVKHVKKIGEEIPEEQPEGTSGCQSNASLSPWQQVFMWGTLLELLTDLTKIFMEK